MLIKSSVFAVIRELNLSKEALEHPVKFTIVRPSGKHISDIGFKKNLWSNSQRELLNDYDEPYEHH